MIGLEDKVKVIDVKYFDFSKFYSFFLYDVFINMLWKYGVVFVIVI